MGLRKDILLFSLLSHHSHLFISSIRPPTRQPIYKNKTNKKSKNCIFALSFLPLCSSLSTFPVVTLLHSLCAYLKEDNFKHSLIRWSHLTNEHGPDRHTSDSSYKTPNLLRACVANVLFSEAWR